jgi:hypothetical protein
MDTISLFKHEGEARIQTQLENGFDKIILDFIRLSAQKVGFDEEQSELIASTFFDPIFEKMSEMTEIASPHMDLGMMHRDGQLQLKCEIPSLNLFLDRTYTL